jgi:hypothetical protein
MCTRWRCTHKLNKRHSAYEYFQILTYNRPGFIHLQIVTYNRPGFFLSSNINLE